MTSLFVGSTNEWMRTISECGKYVLQMGNAYVGKELLATRRLGGNLQREVL